MSPVRNAPELSNETRVDEEQRWVARGHAQATLEIRRKLPELRDGRREYSSAFRLSVLLRWSICSPQQARRQPRYTLKYAPSCLFCDSAVGIFPLEFSI